MVALKTLQDLIAKFTPEIRKAFELAVNNIKSDAVIDKMIEAIKAGDINAAVRFSGISEAAMRPLTLAIERAYEAGGVFTSDQFRRPVDGVKFRFDVRNSRAEAYVRDYSSQLVTRITNEELAVVRAAIFEGVAAGQGPDAIARSLVGLIDKTTGLRSGGVIGLTEQQAQWVRNMRTDLENLDKRYFTRERRDMRFDSTVQKAIDSGTPLSNDVIQGLTDKYNNQLLAYRGETIARTESINALNKAAGESVNQLVESGGVPASSVTRIWDATEHTFIDKPGHTRKTHVDMDEQEVGLDEPFVSPSGARMMHPGDTSLGAPAEETINCRCRNRIKIDWLQGLRGKYKNG